MREHLKGHTSVTDFNYLLDIIRNRCSLILLSELLEYESNGIVKGILNRENVIPWPSANKPVQQIEKDRCIKKQKDCNITNIHTVKQRSTNQAKKGIDNQMF